MESCPVHTARWGAETIPLDDPPERDGILLLNPLSLLTTTNQPPRQVKCDVADANVNTEPDAERGAHSSEAENKLTGGSLNHSCQRAKEQRAEVRVTHR